jgi:hypothetical protein
MNLYRIDMLHDDRSEPLCDLVGPRLIRNSSEARSLAREQAKALGVPAAVTRIQGAGMLKHMGTYMPNGTFDRFGPEA